MSKKAIWIISTLVVLVILLVVLKKSGALGKDEGTKVSAEKAAVRSITETVTASGKVYPEVEVKISSDISGEIVELTIAEGDTVRKGQMLARIYADIYASQRDQAAATVSQTEAQVANAKAQLGALKATLDQTEAAYKRQKTLLDQKVISQSEFEQASQAYFSAQSNYQASKDNINANLAGVRSAQASLNRASKDVSRTTITAPMDGVVSLMLVKKGERVVGTAQMTGTEMMRVADLNSIEVQVDVGENDIPKVKIGDSAIVQVDAYNNRKFKGIVYKIANPSSASSSTTSSASSSTTITNYQVHIRLLQDSYKDLLVKGKAFPFRPNMTASADIQTKTHAQALSVPLNAVTTRDKNSDDAAGKDKKEKKDNADKASTSGNNDDEVNKDDLQEVVFVLQQDGTVKKVVVTTDIQDINNIEIKTGLKPGDEVISGPYDVVNKQLKQGTKVKVVPKSELVQTFKKN